MSANVLTSTPPKATTTGWSHPRGASRLKVVSCDDDVDVDDDDDDDDDDDADTSKDRWSVTWATYYTRKTDEGDCATCTQGGIIRRIFVRRNGMRNVRRHGQSGGSDAGRWRILLP